jgi:hypothetical protein
VRRNQIGESSGEKKPPNSNSIQILRKRNRKSKEAITRVTAYAAMA